MYTNTSVAGAGVAGIVAYTGFATMQWIWFAVALVFLGLLVVRWSTTLGVRPASPAATVEPHLLAVADDLADDPDGTDQP